MAWPSRPEASNSTFWIKDQQRRLHSILKDALFDVIVLPIQQSIISNDKTARMMAARFVADDIRQLTELNVMPVEFVHTLLGEYSFQYSDSDVNSLQNRYQAKHIVSLYLRDDFADLQKFILVGVLQSGSDILNTHYIHVEKPTDEKSLSTLISSETPKFVATLLDHNKQIETQDSGSNFNNSIPDSFENLTTPKTPIETALHFQLLGLLTSSKQRLKERTRYFERSLLALRRASKNIPEYNILKARALFYLYRRPEAVSLLSSTNSVEEKAFLEFLNGNYYDMEKHVEQLSPNLFRALASIELRQLANLYEIPMTDDVIEWVDEPWRYLFEYAANDADRWDTRNNFVFFQSLSGLFPKFDTEYDNATIAKISTEQLTDDYNTEDLLFETTINKLTKDEGLNLCCYFDEGVISELDILNFYRILGLGNFLRSLDKKVNLQALKISTSELFQPTSSLLEGDRTFTRLKVQSIRNEIERSTESDHPKLLQSLVDNALEVILGSGETDWDLVRARNVLLRHLDHYKAYFDLDPKLNGAKVRNPDIGDWPRNVISGRQVGESHSHEYTNNEFWHLKSAHQFAEPGDRKKKLFKELKNRFDGHPDKTAYLASVLEDESDKDGAIEILKNAVDSGKNTWEVYDKLAAIYLQDGNYIEATNTYLMYPNFSAKEPENRVKLSNRAYEAGSHPYWKGEYQLAKPLYEIAANLNTGSHASLTSALRLAYIKFDYITAAQYARQAATRYASYYRYRDFLALWHLFGFSEDADAAFRELAPRSETPYIWSALFVGHRKKATDLDDIAEELTSYIALHELQRDLVKRYVVLQSRIDRKLADQNLEIFSELLKNVDTTNGQYYIAVNHRSLAANLQPNLDELLADKKIEGLSTPPANSVQCDDDDIGCYQLSLELVPSRHELFLRAFRDLEAGQYEKALEKFIQFDIYYTVQENFKTLGSEVLPYVAMAASKLKRSAEIANYLEENYDGKGIDTFDSRITKAIIDASLDSIPKAIEQLKKAFILIPYTESRATFSWYQLAEVCEWLFKSTGDDRFIKMALGWMQDFQVIHPIHAWSYAFEAKYSGNSSRQLRALAIAEFLDSESNWLKDISEEKKLRAREWLIENNPFDITKQIKTEEQI